jgi:hypothetical protein
MAISPTRAHCHTWPRLEYPHKSNCALVLPRIISGYNAETQQDTMTAYSPGPPCRRTCYNNLHHSHGKCKSHETANHDSL